MKLEFLPDGSADCPLIRLYAFSCQEVEVLHEAFVSLATGAAAAVVLEDLPGIQALSTCQVRLKVGSVNRGGRIVKGPAEIEWQLTLAGWGNLAGLTKPFCQRPVSGHHWLDRTGPVSLLLSPDGKW
jgi:hypothetical protein